MIRFCIVVATIGIATSLQSDQTLVGKKAINFKLPDQFEKVWNWNSFENKNVVIALADRKGSEFISAWVEPLRKSLGEKVAFVPIADVSAVPFFLKSFIRGKIAEKYSYPLILDWDGEVSEYYAVAENSTTMIFVGNDGLVKVWTAGVGKKDEVEKFKAAVSSWVSR